MRDYGVRRVGAGRPTERVVIPLDATVAEEPRHVSG
jgi:hypothetical protein